MNKLFGPFKRKPNLTNDIDMELLSKCPCLLDDDHLPRPSSEPKITVVLPNDPLRGRWGSCGGG